ncbi:hypothetical protein GCM10007385_44560 [Tateyamaria omphalii]|uniref:sulfotransferase family 2 domain-containing protein n=1 Tax=Tateyamaria omphalii TaxID=299262 RepID=UPI00167538EF|nr:sulfotransferase family 2 domain-containing protein [Tateyamaria omphalii]GGX70595.1 hypothetical protein GCM10007385_44560 [Tateyamaria omphalii]
MRTIILHYHLFKNAGTSLDSILKDNFGPAWVTNEFPMAGNDNTGQVEAWIAQNPSAIAFSSHTMVGPIPSPTGVHVVPVMMLRDPIARIRSAYRFERKQDADTWGAQLAKEHDFEGYVRARLERNGDRQCRNFQTSRLASMAPGPEPELERALVAAKQLHMTGMIGLVDGFGDALATLQRRVKPVFPAFEASVTHKNVSSGTSASDTAALDELLYESNHDDIELLSAVASWG